MTVRIAGPRDALSVGKLNEAHATIESALRLGARDGSGALIAYSGGKDGLVVALLAQEHGVTEGACEVSFCFDRQVADIRATAERLGFNVTYREQLSYGWLREHPQHIFARDTGLVSVLCQRRQIASFERVAAERGARVIFTGRKRRGNSVKQAVYEKGAFVMAHPLACWDDGDVWTFLRDRGVARPWVYDTVFGRREGNSAWPFYRESADAATCWRAIYDTGVECVERASAAGIQGAVDCLARADG